MPGFSLWLIPPATSDDKLTSSLQSLISTTLPPYFTPAVNANILTATAPPVFQPHLTLTSNVSADVDLSLITLPDLPIETKFKSLEAGDTFFTKLTLHVKKSEGLVKLAVECRRRFVEGYQGEGKQAEEWGEQEYTPHVSLVYDGRGKEEVEGMMDKLWKIVVEEAGVEVEKEERSNVMEGMVGWRGGKIVLVNCELPIEEWKIVKERVLDS